MSIQLLPTTRAYQKKQKQQEEAVEGRHHEKLIAKSPTKQRQQQTNNWSSKISSTPSSPISSTHQFAQSSKSTPFITIPGGIKRSRPPEMDLPKMSNQNTSSGALPTNSTIFFNDDLDVDAEGPKLKQRRYEERMSSQLGGIYISPEKQSTSKIEQQKSRPKIEEIIDWDEELLEDESELIRQAISAPIIEEPCTTPTKMDELFNTTGVEGKQQKDMEGPKIVELDNKEEYANDEGYIENGNEKDWTGPSGKIVLSEKLRQLIRHDRDGQHSPLLTRSQIRTGKELIPYIPSPLALQPSISTNAQIEELKEADEGEEVLNDELLPETVNSPRIEEFLGESMPPTPSLLEPTISNDDFPRNTAYSQQIGKEPEMEEEEAMEID